jgi:ATP-dependent helicase/nuclease subunit A
MPDIRRFPQRSELADASQRADALDVHQSWIVEAPAGSGKTGLLVQRYLKLLADESVTNPDQVLAITFTTKATAELRERVLKQLQSVAERTAPANEFDRATRQLAAMVLVRDVEFGWSLLDQPNRLNVRTIDSVCSEVANSLPVLSGSGGRRSPVEDPTPLYALAARRTFFSLGGADRDLHESLSNILLHRDGNLAECERLLSEMLALRDQWGEFIPVGRANFDDAWLDANVLPKLERALDQAICAALTKIVETIPSDVLTQLTTAAADMAVLEGYKGKPSTIVVCAGRRNSPGPTVEDLEHWRALTHLLIAPSSKSWRKVFSENIVGFETGKFEQEQLRHIVRALEDNDEVLIALCKLGTLPPAKYPADQWAVAKSLFRVLNRALAELQLVFAERGECDFTEVSLAARIALTASDGPHDLEAALGVRLQHLLVDEMQDTSSSQYELIQTLTRNWDGHSQTVFLVGDPRQSIYLFRQARVERFLRTMHSGQFGDLPVGVLRLTANFRSQAALVDDFNTDFANIFPAASDNLHPEEVPYVHAASARSAPGDNETTLHEAGVLSIAALGNGSGNSDDTANNVALAANASPSPRVWHSTVLPYETDRVLKARKVRGQRLADAQQVCRIVASWRCHPLSPGRTSPWKIAVLCRSRSHLDEIVAAFKSAAIPFRAVDIDPLKERPEVQDLIALTRALLHPADRVAWLAVLHAPWCGLSLSELHTLAGADDHTWAERAMQQVVIERGHLLPDEACQRLQRIWPALEAAVASRARISLAQRVERTWRSLGGDSYLDATQLANALRYLQLLDKMDEDSAPFDLALLQRQVEKLYAAPALHSDAVDLLTIHKAKGLEWDVVIVPALERRAPSNRSHLLNWVELDSSDEQSAHVLLAPIAGKGEASQELTKWINGIHNAREAAERKRLFYVACTRAREELHLFAAAAMSAKDGVLRPSNSLLAAAWPAADETFSAPVGLEQQDQPRAVAAAAGPFEERIDDRPALIQRLPLAFNPAVKFRNERPLGYGNLPNAPANARFARPEGTLAARAFGNAVHAFLEQIALRIAANGPAANVLAALPRWRPRVAALLRSEGLQPAVVERLSQRVLVALENTLKDPTGLWLLSAHAGAATEYALTAWSSHRSNVRIDRIFRAGPGPLTTGSSHLWIVDYKTTTHGSEGLEAFLVAEKTKYAPQLEAYASVLSQTQAASSIMLALYCPLIARLIWWPWQK